MRLAWISLAGLCPPLLCYFQAPFVKSTGLDPVFFIGAGWLLIAAFAVGLALAKVFLSLLDPRSRELSLFFSFGIIVCLLMVTILLVNPELMERYVPGWQGSLGIVAALFALFALVLSVFKFLRAAVLILAWGCVTLVLGTEVLFKKLPQDLFDPNFEKLAPLIPKMMMGMEGGERVEPDKEAVRIVAVSALGVPAPGVLAQGTGQSFAAQLGALLNSASGGKRAYQVEDVSAPGQSLRQAKDVLQRELARVAPQLVVLGSGHAESRTGQNAFGLKGLDEEEAYNYAEPRARFAQMPIVNQLADSRIVQLARLGEEFYWNGGSDGEKVRIPVERYRELLTECVKMVRSGGAEPLLLSDLFAPGEADDSPYLRAMQEVAAMEKVHIIGWESEFEAARYETLMNGDDELTSRGHTVLAQSIFRALKELKGGTLGSLFEGLREPLRREFVLSANSAALRDDVIIKLQTAPGVTGYYKVVLRADDKLVDTKRFDSTESLRVRFRLDEELLKNPAVRLSLTVVRASTPDASIDGDRLQFSVDSISAGETFLYGTPEPPPGF